MEPKPALQGIDGSRHSLSLCVKKGPVVSRAAKVHNALHLGAGVADMTLWATDFDMLFDLKDPELPRSAPQLQEPANGRLKLRSVAVVQEAERRH